MPDASSPFGTLMEITSRPAEVFLEGRGSWLIDARGKRYLDFVQGWAVNCLGHSPPVLVEALAQQAKKLMNCSPAYYNAPMIELARCRGTNKRPRSELFRQQRCGGERGCDQARAQMGRPPQGRRLRDHHHGARLPRPHARDHVGLGQARVGEALRARRCRASPRRRSTTSPRSRPRSPRRRPR